jgi:hypothetical protein
LNAMNTLSTLSGDIYRSGLSVYMRIY